MNQSPVGSFFKFFIGFMIFISTSLGLTYAVSTMSAAKDQAQQTAAAVQAMLATYK